MRFHQRQILPLSRDTLCREFLSELSPHFLWKFVEIISDESNCGRHYLIPAKMARREAEPSELYGLGFRIHD